MTNDEVWILTWTSENDEYRLRDDRATGIRPDEAYSLFRIKPEPYGRVVVLAGSLGWAMTEAWKHIKIDRNFLDNAK